MGMLEIIKQIEIELPNLLKEESKWTSLYVDYHPPTVERLWRQVRDYRIYLHKIHPCKPEEALFHPHPWPSAMRLLSGSYDMAIGYGAGEKEPPIAARMIMHAGSLYEMSEKDSWHYVAPIDNPTFTLMITGRPWERWSPRSEKKLCELNRDQTKALFDFFTNKYAGKGEDITKLIT